MNYIIFSSLAWLAGIFIFTSAFIRIKYLYKVYDYCNKGVGEDPDSLLSKLHRWSKKISAAVLLLISVGVFCFNLILTLPIELEGMEYGVSGDELKQLKSEHKELADSDFIDFVESYLKFGKSNAMSHASALKYNLAVDRFVEARKLNIANYDDLLKHKEAVKQLEREKTIALEAEKKRIADAERQSTSTTSSEPSIGTVVRVDTSTGNVLITGYSRVNVGKSTSVTVNGSRVKDEGDLRVGDRCLVRDAREFHASNLICTR